MAKRKKVSPDVMVNIKSNIAELEEKGTEKQKGIIKNEFGYIKKAESISEASARHIARRLEIGFEKLCEPSADHPFTVTGIEEALSREKSSEKKNKAEEKEEKASDVMSLFAVFLKCTGMTSAHAAECLGVSASWLSHAKNNDTRIIHRKVEAAMCDLPKAEEKMKEEDPKKLIALFEAAASEVRKENEGKKKKAAEKKVKTVSINEDKSENKSEAKEKDQSEKTNLDFYSEAIIRNAKDFIKNGKQTAARATANAIRAFIPDSADTPEKVIEWLNAVHVDRFVLSEAEEAMLDGYFRLHKNAITTLFSETYMYTSKAESGLFAGVPGDITLEYLKDHAVTRGDDDV